MPSQHQQFHNTNKTNLEHPKSTQNKTKQPTQHKSFSNITTHPLNQPTTYKLIPDQQHPISSTSPPTTPIKTQQQSSGPVPIVADQSVTWISFQNSRVRIPCLSIIFRPNFFPLDHHLALLNKDSKPLSVSTSAPVNTTLPHTYNPNIKIKLDTRLTHSKHRTRRPPLSSQRIP